VVEEVAEVDEDERKVMGNERDDGSDEKWKVVMEGC
jgi:hypothetical protein